MTERFLTKDQIFALGGASLSKEVLIAQVVGTIAAPLRGLVTVLSGPSRGLVTCPLTDQGQEGSGIAADTSGRSAA